MPELRLILMVVGGVFLICLAWWELRRSHQVRGSDLPHAAPEPVERQAGRQAERTSDWDMPPLELPRMSARDPEARLPIVELDPAEFADLEARAADTTAPAPVAELGDVDGLLDELGASQARDPPIFEEALPEASAPEPLPAPPPRPPEAVVATPLAAADSVQFTAPVDSTAQSDLPDPPDPPMPPVVVEWRSPQANEVLSVRLVSTGEKFSGRAVRLALAAEGFSIGKFSIFHKPAADGRALLSIASLNKPGTFDRQSIDLQRYSGLNLFTVLPGPLPGPDAVDELLECAQILSRRLRGALQDEKGAPLTPLRTAAMRSAAAATPT